MEKKTHSHTRTRTHARTHSHTYTHIILGHAFLVQVFILKLFVIYD